MIQFVTENLIPFAFWELTFSVLQFFLYYSVLLNILIQRKDSIIGRLHKGRMILHFGKEYEMPMVFFIVYLNKKKVFSI